MIHEVTKSGPWFDVGEIVAIDVFLADDHARVTLKSGNEFEFFADREELDRLVAAWRTVDRRDDPDAMDRRKALS